MPKSKEERILDKAADIVMRQKEKEAEDFAEIIQNSENFRFPKKGEIVEAKVVQTNKEGVLLDVGAKSEGFMPWEEYNGKEEETLQPGQTIQVYVSPKRSRDHLLLSKKEADFRLDWAKFEEVFEQNKPIVVKIEKMIKGGFLTRLNSLNTFLPASHISLKKRDNLRKFVGEKVSVRVIELNRESRNIVLSRKILLLEQKEKRREETLASLEEGQIVTGRVNSITKFGIFVDLGGIDGLVYPENLSWGWVKDPQDIFSKGDKLKLKILKLDREKGKISLGLKQTKPDPWKEVKSKYQVGSILSGKVTHVTNFGAFVEIEEGLEGLIHVSDFSWEKRIEDPTKVLEKRDKVEVKILSIDVKKKKISLGLKQTKPDPWKELLQKYEVGDMILGKVQQITNFGVFVNLAPGIDGLIHVSELDEEYVPHPEKIASVGNDIKAEIVEIDEKKRRIRLSVRQLMETKRKKERTKKKAQREQTKEKKSRSIAVHSSKDNGIVIGDFIEDKIKERLRKSF